MRHNKASTKKFSASLWMTLVVLLSMLLSTLLSTTAAMSHADIANVFSASDKKFAIALLPNGEDEGVVRKRAVLVDQPILNAATAKISASTNKSSALETTLRFNFFDDAPMLVTLTSATPIAVGDKTGVAYSGHVPGIPFSSVTLVELNGVLAANVRALSQQYQLRYRDDTGYEVREIDASVFRDHDVPSRHQAFNKKETLRQQHDANYQRGIVAPAQKAARKNSPTTALDDGSTIDAMVIYTPQALAAAGGEAGMQSRIALVAAENNTSYQNSNVTQRVRIVYSGLVNFDDSGNISQDLTKLRATADGVMDEVHPLRDAYGADMVSLWVANAGNLCGIGYLMSTESAGFAPSAFNVVALSCATGNLTFGHELGHNMGLRHDVFVDTGTNTLTPEGSLVAVSGVNYAHGYIDTANRFRTIMAYTDGCTAAGTTCPKIKNFSNPDVMSNGAVTGVAATANNARALNDTRETVANFRQTVTNPIGVVSFLPSSYTVIEGSRVNLSVQRLGTLAGAASVRYTAISGTAVATDFVAASGLLQWAEGEGGSKTFSVETTQDTLVEGDETFTVTLSNPSGVILSSASATVLIRDDEIGVFPANCAMPSAAEGWSTPAGATTGWQVGLDSAREGNCSLKSISPGDSPTDKFTNRSQIQFVGNFVAGNITFDRRVSSELNWDCLRFSVDGVVQNIGSTCTGPGTTSIGASGEAAWANIVIPVSAGQHTLLWSYEKDDSVAVGSDAAWIDALTMPLATVPMTTLSITRTGTGQGTVVSTPAAINCGMTCTAQLNGGITITLTAQPDRGSVFAGWSNAAGLTSCVGLQTCTFTLTQAITVTANFQLAAAASRLTTTTTLNSSANPSLANVAFTLTAVVLNENTTPAIGGIGGNVSFIDIQPTGAITMCGNVPLVPLGSLKSANCVVPIANRRNGISQYQVIYHGDTNYAQSTATLRQIIGGAANQAALTIGLTPVKPMVGQAVTVTVLASGLNAVPTGNIVITAPAGSTNTCANVALVALPGQAVTSAVATCSITGLNVGSYNVSAQYAGDTNHTANNASAALAIIASGPTDYTDMWWAGLAENGWGMSITQHGTTQFNALYVYDAAGKPVWYVMPGGEWRNNFTTYTGAIYQPISAPFSNYNSAQFIPGAAVGMVTLNFTSSNTATLNYTIGSASGQKNIARQVIAPATPDTAPRIIVNDLWWAGNAENGWGINLAQSGRTVFAVWYTYGLDGKATWFVIPGGTWNGTVFTGAAFSTTGSPWVGTTYNSSALVVASAGNVTINFIDSNTAVMRYMINGVAETKVIYRQPF
jgi:hypothetical protein